jgi:hypothetical protein
MTGQTVERLAPDYLTIYIYTYNPSHALVVDNVQTIIFGVLVCNQYMMIVWMNLH